MDDEYDDSPPAYPWSWRASVVLAGDFVANVLHTAGTLVNSLATQLAADHNYRIDQRNFRDAVARDIETITNEE